MKVTKVNDPSRYNSDELLEYYRNERADVHGRMLSDLWEYSLEKKEDEHQYIQWMWPIKSASRAQPGALGPVIDNEFAKRLQADKKVQECARTSFKKMLEFYGLHYDEKAKRVVLAKNFNERSNVWLTRDNHNHYRITRILESLGHFGLRTEAKAFFQCLKQLKIEMMDSISNASMEMWCKKISKNIWKEVFVEIQKAEEENRFACTLKGIASAKKTTWIFADLTVDEPNCFERMLWCIFKHFECMRRCFFGFDLEKSKKNLLKMQLKTEQDPKRYGRFKDLYQKAAANFNQIVSKKYQLK